MEKPRCASIFLIDNADNILLLLRDKNREPGFIIPYANMWDAVGGHIENGESPRECIVRELMEELQTHSFNSKRLPLWRVMDFPDRVDYVFWDFLGGCNLNTLNKQLTEGQRVCWFSLDEVRNMELAFGWKPYVIKFLEWRWSLYNIRIMADPNH